VTVGGPVSRVNEQAGSVLHFQPLLRSRLGDLRLPGARPTTGPSDLARREAQLAGGENR
jgi:hypothetical protein